MQTYALSQLTKETLNALVTLHEADRAPEAWENMQIPLTSQENVLLAYLKEDAQQHHLTRLNDATLWARTIYPLLRLAEQERIRAWIGVPLKATYPTFRLEGEADGVLAPSVGGGIRPPYFIVHEAKRGFNAPDPLYQLLGEMLAAAWLNWKKDTNSQREFPCWQCQQDITFPEQEIFGCYTVATNWAFVRGTVSDMETGKPTLAIEEERIVQRNASLSWRNGCSPLHSEVKDHAHLSIIAVIQGDT